MRKQRVGSPYECVMCSKMFSTLNIAQHLKHTHKMKTNEYYDLKNPEVNSKCCLECGNPTKFVSIVKGYADFCSRICTDASTVRTTKIVNSKRSKYGEDFKPIYEKMKSTNLAKTQEEKEQYSINLAAGIKRFHEANPGIFVGRFKRTEEHRKQLSDAHKNRSQEEIKASTELRKLTCLEKYGVEHVMYVPEYKEKCLNWLKDKDKVAISRIKSDITKIKNGFKVILTEEELAEYKHYGAKVQNLTYRLAPKIFGEDVFDKIGLCGVPGAMQIDHIVSKSFGWKNKIPAEIIACKHNLQLLTWEQNLSKSVECHMDHRTLISLFMEDCHGYR